MHLDHGVGRYRGLTSMSTPDGEAEFLQIDYAKDAKLYVPVAQLHLISRYSGADPETAPLHSLGKGDWEKARKKAALQVRDTAAELLNIYALRQSRKGYAFKFSLPITRHSPKPLLLKKPRISSPPLTPFTAT